jgi:hypothetical protein
MWLKYIHTEHSQNTLSHTHLLTFSLTLQDLEYIGGVETRSHSLHFSHFDPEPFHLPITLFNNFQVSNIDLIPTYRTRNH